MRRKGKFFAGLKNREAARRYGVYYYKLADTDVFTVLQDSSGSTNDKARAYGLASMHCGQAELRPGEYAKAVVIDRYQGRMLRSYTLRPGKMIEIKEM